LPINIKNETLFHFFRKIGDIKEIHLFRRKEIFADIIFEE